MENWCEFFLVERRIFSRWAKTLAEKNEDKCNTCSSTLGKSGPVKYRTIWPRIPSRYHFDDITEILNHLVWKNLDTLDEKQSDPKHNKEKFVKLFTMSLLEDNGSIKNIVQYQVKATLKFAEVCPYLGNLKKRRSLSSHRSWGQARSNNYWWPLENKDKCYGADKGTMLWKS